MEPSKCKNAQQTQQKVSDFGCNSLMAFNSSQNGHLADSPSNSGAEMTDIALSLTSLDNARVNRGVEKCSVVVKTEEDTMVAKRTSDD